MRKYFYHTLSGILFLLLIATAWSSALTLTFSKPDNIKAWLSESKLYDHFVDNAIKQSQEPSENGTSNDVSEAPLSDPAVQQAAKAAFTPDVVQKAVNTFLDGNYAWLQGKTEKPEFNINLTEAKALLATNLGNYAAERAKSLPRCKTLQEVYQAEQEYLAATCKPITVTPAQVGAAVTEDVVVSKDFLVNPVITPDTFSSETLKGGDQEGAPAEQPYYEKFSSLPSAYKLATALPWILALVSVLAGAGIVFLAATKRSGLKRVGKILIGAGTIVLLLIVVSGAGFSRLEHQVFTKDNVGLLQQSLVDFAHRAQSALTKVDLWFGITFVLLGIAVLIALRYIWPDAKYPKKPMAPDPKEVETPEPNAEAPKSANSAQL